MSWIMSIAIMALSLGVFLETGEPQDRSTLSSFVSSKEAINTVLRMNDAISREDFDGAIRHATQFLSKGKSDPRVRFTLGNAHFNKENYRQALSEYQSLLGAFGGDPQILSNVGKCYYLLKEYDQAAVFLSRSIRAREDQSVHMLLAKSLVNTGQDSAALPHFQNELARSPHDKTLYLALADLHRRRGDLEEAGRMAQSWLESRDMDPALVRILAQVRLAERRYSEARALYQMLEFLGAATADDVRRLADLYLVDKAYPEAVRYLVQLGTLGAQTLEDRERLAAAYVRMNRAADAVKVLEALVAEKEDSGLFAQLGYAQEVLKNWDAALKAFAKATALNAHDAEPVLAAARVHFRQDQMDAAEELYWTASALEGGAARAYAGLGEIAWKKGERRQAVAHYKRAQSLDPTDSRIYDRWLSLSRRL